MVYITVWNGKTKCTWPFFNSKLFVYQVIINFPLLKGVMGHHPTVQESSLSCPVLVIGHFSKIRSKNHLKGMCRSRLHIWRSTNMVFALDWVGPFSTITAWWLFLPLWKMWVRQLGRTNFPIYGKMKVMFQTTTNITINHYKPIIHPPLYQYVPHKAVAEVSKIGKL